MYTHYTHTHYIHTTCTLLYIISHDIVMSAFSDLSLFLSPPSLMPCISYGRLHDIII